MGQQEVDNSSLLQEVEAGVRDELGGTTPVMGGLWAATGGSGWPSDLVRSVGQVLAASGRCGSRSMTSTSGLPPPPSASASSWRPVGDVTQARSARVANTDVKQSTEMLPVSPVPSHHLRRVNNDCQNDDRDIDMMRIVTSEVIQGGMMIIMIMTMMMMMITTKLYF